MNFEKIEKRDTTSKYGFSNIGMFSKEFIKKGELVFQCEEGKCDYLAPGDASLGKTREEALEIMKKHPHLTDFIKRYAYMIDDDLYDWPKFYMEQKCVCSCLFFNHGCDPNCYLGHSVKGFSFLAIRDIEPDEELTYDYQFFDTEASFYEINCKCGSYKCRGRLKFDEYRNTDWQKLNYAYASSYVQRKIDELKTKWYSPKCYLKRYSNDKASSQNSLFLTSLVEIKKDELIAKKSNLSKIIAEFDLIKNSDRPNCYLIGNDVFALADIEPNKMLTVKF